MAITISGSGIVEANLADDAVTLAKMASGTDGQIITYDASGDPAAVGPGTDGQVLTSTGSTTPPAFEAAAAGGKLLQAVAFVEDSSASTIATSTYTDTGLSVSITPTVSTSKILCMWNMQYNPNSTLEGFGVRLMRDSTAISSSGTLYDISVGDITPTDARFRGSWMYLDSPSTTSATTYKVQVASYNGNSISINNGGNKTQLVLMEIGV
jgi:hypothetical protein